MIKIGCRFKRISNQNPATVCELDGTVTILKLAWRIYWLSVEIAVNVMERCDSAGEIRGDLFRMKHELPGSSVQSTCQNPRTNRSRMAPCTWGCQERWLFFISFLQPQQAITHGTGQAAPLDIFKTLFWWLPTRIPQPVLEEEYWRASQFWLSSCLLLSYRPRPPKPPLPILGHNAAVGASTEMSLWSFSLFLGKRPIPIPYTIYYSR